MKKLLSVIAILALLASPAYGQKTKSAMTTEINNNLPDNTVNQITPGILRSTLIDMVNSWYGLIDTTNSGTGASTLGQLTVTGTSSFTGALTASNTINQTGSVSGTITEQTQSAAGTWNWNWPTSAGASGQALLSAGGGSSPMTWGTVNQYNGLAAFNTLGNPAGTTSTVGVMMGIGSGCTFTPTKSTRVLLWITGTLSNNTASDGVVSNIRYGTGSAPANGAAQTGSQAGGNVFILNNANTAGALFQGFNQGIAASLTLNTAYWFDVVVGALTGGTASFTNINCLAAEI